MQKMHWGALNPALSRDMCAVGVGETVNKYVDDHPAPPGAAKPVQSALEIMFCTDKPTTHAGAVNRSPLLLDWHLPGVLHTFFVACTPATWRDSVSRGRNKPGNATFWLPQGG